MEDWIAAAESVQQMDTKGMILSKRTSYGRSTVKFDREKIQGLSTKQLMCIADRGIPPFGGAMQGDDTVVIYTD